MTLPGSFAAIFPDDIIVGKNCLTEMAIHYAGGYVIAGMQVEAEETSQYGIFRLGGLPRNQSIQVAGMVEKPATGTAPSSIAAVGRYILDPMIFEVLVHTPFGRGGELQLTDALTIATKAIPATAFQFSGTRHDCGNHDGLLAASVVRKACVRQENSAPATSGPLSATSSGATHAITDTSSPTRRPAENTACGNQLTNCIVAYRFRAEGELSSRSSA